MWICLLIGRCDVEDEDMKRGSETRVCSATRLKVLVACKGANPVNIGLMLMDK